jgi:hypothetical protein
VINHTERSGEEVFEMVCTVEKVVVHKKENDGALVVESFDG